MQKKPLDLLTGKPCECETCFPKRKHQIWGGMKK